MKLGDFLEANIFLERDVGDLESKMTPVKLMELVEFREVGKRRILGISL